MKFKTLLSIIMGISIVTCCITADFHTSTVQPFSPKPIANLIKTTEETTTDKTTKNDNKTETEDKKTATQENDEITITKTFEQEKVSITFNQLPLINKELSVLTFVSSIQDKGFGQIFQTRLKTDKEETIEQLINDNVKMSQKTYNAEGKIEWKESMQIKGYPAKIVEVKYTNGLCEKALIIATEKRFYLFDIIGFNSLTDATTHNQEFQKFINTVVIS